MTEEQNTNQQQVENKVSDKELNFRKVEAKQREAEQQLYQERQARLELERRLQEIQSKSHVEEDDDDNEPYVDKKKLEKKLSAFERKWEDKFDRKVEEKARMLIKEKEDEEWLNEHSDFSEIMNEENLTKLVSRSPALAASIKRIPDSPEKQKLVYNSIKAMELHKTAEKQPSIQEKIDANKRSPYYIPGGPANPPYNMTGDFSPSGQKSAYEKMKQLQKNSRM